MIRRAIHNASLATLVALLPHYLLFYLLGTPLWTEAIAEWIMAHTPPRYTIPIMEQFGEWAKPLAMTGGLATLGGGLFAAALFIVLTKRRAVGLLVIACVAALYSQLFSSSSWLGQLSFFLPAAAFLVWQYRYVAQPLKITAPAVQTTPRRTFLRAALPIVMSSGTLLVAVESYWRNEARARRATLASYLYPYRPPADREAFGAGIVRPAVTPVEKFYYISKNAVDPAIDAQDWRLLIQHDGRTIRHYTYTQLLALPRTERYVTLRCISNNLQSDYMSNASWSGLRPQQFIDRNSIPQSTVEVAIVGADGHGDSVSPDYFFSEDVLFALGMNGQTLNRLHGYPLRLLVPRYYGCKNIKWITTINFVSQPYFGTWPKLGYSKELVVHTASHIDSIRASGQGLEIGGVSFAGTRGIRAVQLRVNQGAWVSAEIEPALSSYTWTRWTGLLPPAPAGTVEARAQDGEGNWQESEPGSHFPDGQRGPTIRRFPIKVS